MRPLVGHAATSVAVASVFFSISAVGWDVDQSDDHNEDAKENVTNSLRKAHPWSQDGHNEGPDAEDEEQERDFKDHETA